MGIWGTEAGTFLKAINLKNRFLEASGILRLKANLPFHHEK